ncbi:hypothetical protein [Burkholderia glumae]|uniref:Uncharacterized protein n=1 Tax=Burkholderia glumae TaxID=337 RepID=A0ABY5BF35_BURGL|nr:hypothetical protein [Burkholderia glumae]KHJ64707.1 hypothetical protein NCPPB3923_01665 [Burkholderia glumae]USS44669.1 hypothetical protein NFI99_23875 [Burkholderia glumae]
MTKNEFRSRVFELARERRLSVDVMRDGKLRIWFNLKSKKFLHVDHIDALYGLLRRPGLDRAAIRAEIERVAPGRPCTHRGMREIYEQLHTAARA